MDGLLYALHEIAKNKVIEQLHKVQAGKLSCKQREIRTRHKNALNLTNVQKHGEEWVFPSEKKENVQYFVSPLPLTHSECSVNTCTTTM